MAYSDFTLELVETRLGVSVQPADLFPERAPVVVPVWLSELLVRGMSLALLSEKARSEFIVVPILLATRELSGDAVAIYSGQRLDVDPEHGLSGECDFILTASPPVPMLRAPIAIIVEAKKNDVEAGLGQCAAQLVGAQRFNQNAGKGPSTVFGCVTTGETWQFLRLVDAVLELDRRRYYIDSVGAILAVMQALAAPLPVHA